MLLEISLKEFSRTEIGSFIDMITNTEVIKKSPVYHKKPNSPCTSIK